MEESVRILAHDIVRSKKNRGFWYCFKRYTRIVALFLVLIGVFAVIFLWYFCSGQWCVVGPAVFHWPNDNASSGDLLRQQQQPSYERPQPVDFNLKGNDVIVFLHIQNTGGDVFARHLVEDLALEKPCVCRRKRCRCFRPNRKGRSSWLFSRYTVGWKCGVHPDWYRLSSCADRVLDEEEGKPVKRRYFYITFLRDPIKRYLSEYWHSRQGTRWRSVRLWCRGREVTSKELPRCFDNDESPPTLDEFTDCRYNLAANRQTRMLADLSLVDCYNYSAMPRSEREMILLNSAKHNLHKMAFFGLAEFPKVSSYMFETTFDLTFLDGRGRHPHGGHGVNDDFTSRQIDRIKDVNALDIELYEYAKELLFYRFEKLKTSDPEFEDNFKILSDERMTADDDWADGEDSLTDGL